jgi:hypothetical protein
LAHIYSPNPSYQTRFLSTFYHPSLSVYTDPFLSVKERQRIQTLFQFNYSWLVKSVDVFIHHVSASPATLTYAVNRASVATTLKSPPISMSEGVVEVLSPTSGSAVEDSLDIVNIKRRGTTILVDYNLNVRELTLVGNVLYLFWLLPAIVQLAYASGSKNRGQTGIRLITKLQWIPDPTANPSSSTLLHERGYVIRHEDVFSSTGISSRLASIPALAWLVLSNWIIFWLQIGFSFSSYLLGLLTFLLVERFPSDNNLVKILQNRVINLKAYADSSYPKDFELLWKRLVGFLWVDLLLKLVSFSNFKRGRRSASSGSE